MQKCFVISFSVILLLLITYIIYQQKKIEKLYYLVDRYAIRNSLTYAKQKAKIDKIKCKYVGEKEIVDWRLLYAIRLYEAGADNYQMGVKRISKYTIDNYSVDLWQFAEASRIIKEEYRDFAKENIREFIEYLAKRYNYKHRKNWSKNVYKFYEKIKE